MLKVIFILAMLIASGCGKGNGVGSTAEGNLAAPELPPVTLCTIVAAEDEAPLNGNGNTFTQGTGCNPVIPAVDLNYRGLSN